jgi:phosphatidylglycerol:prolipoprotein diacylglycerol transferase
MNTYFFNTGIQNYTLFGNIATILVFVYIFILFKERRKLISYRSKKIAYAISLKNRKAGRFVQNFFAFLGCILSYGVLWALVVMFNMRLGAVWDMSANYYGMLAPFFFVAFLVSALFGANPLKLMDFFAPALAIHLFFIKIGCYCAGCCYGIHWPGGPRNELCEFQEQFPVQLLEAAWAAIMFFALMYYTKIYMKKHNAKPGLAVPLFVIAYSATRFCSEFFRHEENVLGPFKTYHLFCIMGVFLGVIELLIVFNVGDKVNAYYEGKHKPIDLKLAELEQPPVEKKENKKSTNNKTNNKKVKKK